MMHVRAKKEVNGESNLLHGHDQGVCACVNKEITKTWRTAEV